MFNIKFKEQIASNIKAFWLENELLYLINFF